MCPSIEGGIVDRHYILVSHQHDRFQRGIRPSPGKEIGISVDESVIQSRKANDSITDNLVNGVLMA